MDGLSNKGGLHNAGLLYKNTKGLLGVEGFLLIISSITIYLIGLSLGFEAMDIIIIMFLSTGLKNVYDEKNNKFNTYELIFPITRKNRIKVKYLSILIYILVGFVVTFAIVNFFNLINEQHQDFIVVKTATQSFVFATLVMSTTIPLMYKFKKMKLSALVSLGFIFVILLEALTILLKGVIMILRALAKYEYLVYQLMDFRMPVLLSFIISTIAIVVSYKISEFFFDI